MIVKVFKQTRNSSLANPWHSSRTWMRSAAVTPRKFMVNLGHLFKATNPSPIRILHDPWYSFLVVAAALTSLSLRLEVNYHDLVLKSSQS